MVYFKDRVEAGKKLSTLLSKYKGKEAVVYALPRGGVVLAEEIANFLEVPLDLLFAHKLGHPYQPEYAVAAISESGHVVGNAYELQSLGKEWLDREKERQLAGIQNRRKLYLQDRPEIPIKDKIAIIVDDGIATGLTMQAGILELRDKHPLKIIVAVPVSPKSAAEAIKALADDFIAIEVPEDGKFRGSVGSYYQLFDQVENSEVISILKKRRG